MLNKTMYKLVIKF